MPRSPRVFVEGGKGSRFIYSVILGRIPTEVFNAKIAEGFC